MLEGCSREGGLMTREADIQEILALPQEYCSAVNRRDWDDFELLYATDARWRVPGNERDVVGAKNIREWTENTFANVAFFSQMIGSQKLVRYTPEVANVYTHFQAFNVLYNGGGFQYFMVYDDEMRRDGDRWKFTDRIGHFLFRASVPPDGVPSPWPELRKFE
jgi:ketosteroid isomerase-like protein